MYVRRAPGKAVAYQPNSENAQAQDIGEISQSQLMGSHHGSTLVPINMYELQYWEYNGGS